MGGFSGCQIFLTHQRQPEKRFQAALSGLNQTTLHFPFKTKQHVARFAVEIAAIKAAAVLVGIVAFIGEVVHSKAQLYLLGGAVLQIGVPHGVAALADGAAAGAGFAAAVDAETNCPFVAVKGQRVAGVKAEHMLGRVAAEIVARLPAGDVFLNGVAVGAAIEGVASKDVPAVGDAA